MPRNRVQKNEVNAKGDLIRRKGTVISNKFRIGVRSSGKAGHTLSNADLLAVAGRGGKDGQKARNILTHRGVALAA